MVFLIVLPLHLQLTMAFLIVLPLVLLILTLKNNRGTKLPPGPWKLPLLGNLHNLHHAGDPHRALDKLSGKYGPIMHLKLGRVDNIIISTPEAAREILKNQDVTLASRPQFVASKILFGSQDLMFSPYGSYWRDVRKVCVLELLSARRVKSFRPSREEETSSLVASIMSATAGKQVVVNLSQNFLRLANTATGRAAFGAECKHGQRFITEIKNVVGLASGFNLVDLYPSLAFLSRFLGTTATLERIRDRMDKILDDIIEEHQTNKLLASTQHEDALDDLLDVLLRHKKERGAEFPLSNVKAIVFDMFAAGTETSATVMTWVMAELIRHPAVMGKLQQEVRQAFKEKGRVEEADMEELQYMKLVIKETIRLHPPVPFLHRISAEAWNIGGYNISGGSRVMINIWGISRDPRYWDDAESFIPERFEGSSVNFKEENFQYLAFGAGRRICPGIGFGMVNIELTLSRLLFHFDWGLPDALDLDMTESFGFTLTKKQDLCLTATPRFPLLS